MTSQHWTDNGDLNGLSGAAGDLLTEWLVAHVNGVCPPLTFSLIFGGRSNLTYTIQDSRQQRWIFRRPPLHSVLPTAHDVDREYRVLKALSQTSIPAPPVVGYSADLLEAPFFVMDYVPGVVLRSEEDTEMYVSREQRSALAREMIETLAALHSVRPAEIGLERLGRAKGYGQRQVRRWRAQASEFRTKPRPTAEAVAEELLVRMPTGDVAIVHGDYHLENAILEPRTGRIRAIVDWELCTLGDPLIDLAVTLSYWTLPGDTLRPLSSSPTLAPGFPGRQEMLQIYRDVTKHSIAEFDIYLAFAYWRLAMVLEGVHARFARGAYGDDVPDSEFEHYSEAIDELSHEAERYL